MRQRPRYNFVRQVKLYGNVLSSVDNDDRKGCEEAKQKLSPEATPLLHILVFSPGCHVSHV